MWPLRCISVLLQLKLPVDWSLNGIFLPRIFTNSWQKSWNLKQTSFFWAKHHKLFYFNILNIWRWVEKTFNAIYIQLYRFRKILLVVVTWAAENCEKVLYTRNTYFDVLFVLINIHILITCNLNWKHNRTLGLILAKTIRTTLNVVYLVNIW